MKITALIFGIVFMSFFSDNEDCKVLKESLMGKYEGECRRGLAHGIGKAVGEDTYEGQFRGGLPHGQGVYTWSNGDVFKGKFRRGLAHGRGELTRIVDGEKELITGTWRNGEYVERQEREVEYRIDRQRSIDNVRITQSGEGQQVRVRIWRGGSYLNYQNLRVHHSSGNQVMHGQEIVFEFVTFPFTFSVFYSVPNKMRTGTMDCELEVTILKEGNWEVITNQ